MHRGIHEDGEDQDGAVEHGAHLGARSMSVRQAVSTSEPTMGADERALAAEQDHGQVLSMDWLMLR